MPDIGLLDSGPPRRTSSAPPDACDAADAPAALASAAASQTAILRDSVSAPAVIVIPESAMMSAPQSAAASTDSADSHDAPRAGRTPSGPPPSVPEAMRAADLLWLALAFVLIIGSGLGIRDPWPADEPRFAAIARDMVATGEWLFPRVGGDLYQDKPPVFFWLLATFYSLTGSLRASFLIPSLCAAAGVMFLVYDFGRRLVGRAAGLAAGILIVCSLQFVQTMRGAQIDPTLCFLVTFSLYALLRHLLLGPAWRWYTLGGLAAGIGVITKGVGFLPVLVLIPYFLMRGFGWQGLAPVEAGRGGWRWWLAPLALLAGICLWFVPMLLAVASSSAPEYVQYRDEILFKQTVGRYAAAWHHVKSWYYFVLEVIPPLWLPWSLLLIWLVPRFRDAWAARDARVWLPLAWVLIVVTFFSASPGKRGVYVLPALPALAMASLPFLEAIVAKRAVRMAGIVAALAMWVGFAGLFVYTRSEPLPLPFEPPLVPLLLLAGLFISVAIWRKPIAAFPAALAALALWFSYWLAPLMNGERSGSDFTRAMLAQVDRGEQLGLVAYKEQFLLYLDRPIVNFGHRRGFEGPQEAYDAAAWLRSGTERVLLVPADILEPCFPAGGTLAGRSSDEDWYLVRAASEDCAQKGIAARAIRYPSR